LETGHLAGRVLVQIIRRVICGAETGAAVVAARSGRFAVTDIVEGVFELLAGDWCAVGPVLFAGNDLTE
jgi:hypothetical protein